MWQVNCVNIETREALLHVARGYGWKVLAPRCWLDEHLWVIVDAYSVDGYLNKHSDIATLPLYEAFVRLSREPLPVARFEDFVIPMSLGDAKRVLNDINIIEEVSRTIDWCGIDIEAELSDFDPEWQTGGDLDRQRITWIAACKIMCNHYLGGRHENNH